MMVKMNCEHCKRPFTISNKKYHKDNGDVTIHTGERKYNVSGLIVCHACYSRYKRNGMLEKQPRKRMTDEEVILKNNAKSRRYQARLKKFINIRRQFIKSLSTQELLDEVGYR